MDLVRIERARTKAFYKMLVDRLGADEWSRRRKVLVDQICARETQLDLGKPIEFQLFVPTEGDIDWYILASELSHDHPYSDCAYSSRRIFPYTMSIGACAHLLKDVPNVGGVLDKMLANNNKPETQIFELLTASFYLKNGYEVAFIPENSILWHDGKTRKSPDILVNAYGVELYVECKRADKQTTYSRSEEEAWTSIWNQLSVYMLEVAPWSVVDITFHDQVANVSAEAVISIVNKALVTGAEQAREGSLTAEIRSVDKDRLEQHYLHNSVRANSPQQELLVFGDVNSNEKRSIATVAKNIVRPGGPEEILNVFIKEVSKCVGAQWRCDHAISLEKRSRHFKGLVHDGVTQIPPDKPGVVHIWYETREGVGIEEMRRGKNTMSIADYNASDTSVLGVLLHGVNYYPLEDTYEWAETVQHFARIPDLMSLYRYSLMLAVGATEEIEGISHWEQDKANQNSM